MTPCGFSTSAWRISSTRVVTRSSFQCGERTRAYVLPSARKRFALAATTCISLRPRGAFSRARYHRNVFTTRPELRGTFGMVSSTHWIASQTAMAVLERGGNAFDAAVAAGFVLQVVEPHLNGPGGEVPIILSDARRAAVEVICGPGPAPKAATTSHRRSRGLEEIPG